MQTANDVKNLDHRKSYISFLQLVKLLGLCSSEGVELILHTSDFFGRMVTVVTIESEQCTSLTVHTRWFAVFFINCQYLQKLCYNAWFVN